MKNNFSIQHSTFSIQKGIITTYVLVFGAIFLLLLSGLLGFILLQLRQASQKVAWQEALQVAEAGTNYSRWCLNNEVEDICLTEKEYLDPAGNPIGKFSLTITPRISCGEITERIINSTGWTYNFSDIKREVQVLYARPSVAQYAYLINDNVWAGSDREIRGLYHSNKGIRMDGLNYSLVTSAREEWVCTKSFGCPPCPGVCHEEGGNCICPGVFTTANGNEDLFDYPVSPFDFEGITIDLAQIKSLTQPYPQQYYWPKVSDLDPEGKGYHVKFLNNGTFEVWIITNLEAILAYDLMEGWHYDYSIIEEEYRYGDSISIDPACSLIFIEDHLWVEGEVKGKVTIVSANLIDPNIDTRVILPGNIDYTVLDGSDGLAVFGEKNVLIGPDSPNIMKLRGIFIAQKGYFGRKHYTGTAPTKRGEELTIYGSIVSNGRVGTAWLNPAGQIVSGYLKRENYIDPNLIYSPPHFLPYVSPEFKIVNWEEVE